MVFNLHHLYFIIKTSIKFVGFFYLFFMTLLSNHFYPGFFLEGGGGGGGTNFWLIFSKNFGGEVWYKLLCNCYYKFLGEVVAGYGLLTSQSF